MPLFGDGKYGAKDNSDIALFSFRLTLPDGRVFSAQPKKVKPWNLFK